MVLPPIYTNNKILIFGFTLIEVLVVISIFSILLASTISITSSVLQNEMLNEEREQIVGLLQIARNNAQNNLAQAPHGVAFDPVGFIGYVVFIGTSLEASVESSRQYIRRGTSFTFSSTTPDEIVFLPLSGNVSLNQVIKLIDINRSAASTSIIINTEGYVGW